MLEFADHIHNYFTIDMRSRSYFRDFQKPALPRNRRNSFGLFRIEKA